MITLGDLIYASLVSKGTDFLAVSKTSIVIGVWNGNSVLFLSMVVIRMSSRALLLEVY